MGLAGGWGWGHWGRGAHIARPYGNRTINNDYLYPKRDGKNNVFGINGGILARGWLFPVDISTADLLALSGADDTNTGTDTPADTFDQEAEDAGIDIVDVTEEDADKPISNQELRRLRSLPIEKRFRFSQGKQFQFNPAAINISIDFDTAVAPDASTNSQGNFQGTSIGFASTGVNMIFDRTQEVAAANAGKAGVDPIFRDLGVQKDFFDVFRVVMAANGEYWDATDASTGFIERIGGTVQSGGTTDIMEKIFDIGASGFTAQSNPVAIYFNANLTILGLVTGISYVFTQFNANLVPTQGSIELAVSIMKTSSANGVNNFVTSTANTGTIIPTTNIDNSTANVATNNASTRERILAGGGRYGRGGRDN